jgi:hypothetical protein
MPLSFLRFQPGAIGDTVLMCILASNKNLNSQMRYLDYHDCKTEIDEEHLKQFKYNQISNLSFQYCKTDPIILKNQLLLLENEDVEKEWLLKSHYYGELNYPTIDIIIKQKMLPFVVKAILKKRNTHPNYLPLISQIKDEKILYQFNCYNYAVDRINTEKNILNNTRLLFLEELLNGWDNFKNAIHRINLSVDQTYKSYYNKWLNDNLSFMPSNTYISLVEESNFDYKYTGLSIEERYSLLALADEKFKIL